MYFLTFVVSQCSIVGGYIGSIAFFVYVCACMSLCVSFDVYSSLKQCDTCGSVLAFQGIGLLRLLYSVKYHGLGIQLIAVDFSQ